MKYSKGRLILSFIFFTLASILSAAEFSTLLSNSDQPIPDTPSFSINFKGEDLKCYPIKFIKKKTRKNVIKYQCLKKNIPVQYIEEKEQVAADEQTGRDETKKLRLEIKNKENVGNIYTIEIPEKDAYSPWLARNIAKLKLNNTYYFKYITWLLPAKFYISLRPQFATSAENDNLKFRDAGSRAGFFYYYQFDNGYELIMQYEATVNWDDLSSFVNVSDQSNSNRRLSYLALQYDDYSAFIGKYWSAYYDIASMTDKFMAYGAQSSGAFNNKSDGGESGTGRADRMLQFHMDKEDYATTLQLQFRQPGPPNLNSDYLYGIAGSIVYEKLENITIGGSIAYARFEEITTQMNELGIHGNDLSMIIGASYKYEKYTANAILSYTRNHMNDDLGVYFNGVGSELYLRYDYNDNIRVAGGMNWLTPKDDYYHGDYSIKKAIVSLQYTFGTKTFDDLVYLEISMPQGKLANGEKQATSVAIGVRYKID
jgi:hypothetical protein